MTTLNRLIVPSFDLAWFDLKDGHDPVVLIPGGGGSTKSGVMNQIQIGRYVGVKGFQMQASHMTDEDGKSNFCSAVSGGVMEDKLIVCAVIDDHCHIFLAKRSKEGEIALEKKCEFKADFNQSTDFASVNTVLLGSRFIITGGEDGICKMWSISVEDDDSDVWTAKLVREMKGHEGPIMALSRHPTRPWVVTASKDGTCRMFDASNGQELIKLPALDGVEVSKRATQAMECRGCVFSPDGRYIYTIQSGKRGPSHIVKWLIKDDNYEKDATFKVTPEEVIAAGKVPLTKLRINSRGDVLATGGSDGLISVYNAVKCKKIRVFPNHDLPVTGMAFAPDFVAAGAKATDLLVSCSADNKLATVKLQKSSAVMVWALVLVLVLLALYLYIHVLTT